MLFSPGFALRARGATDLYFGCAEPRGILYFRRAELDPGAAEYLHLSPILTSLTSSKNRKTSVRFFDVLRVVILGRPQFLTSCVS